MELKVVCSCGQKYKFDVEPVNRQMPFAVNCPVCGVDGTPLANNLLMQMPAPPPLPTVPPPTAVAAAPAPGGLRINREAPAPPVAPPVPAAAMATATAAAPARGRPTSTAYSPSSGVPKYMQDNKAIMNNSFMMGILGAILGAIVAIGLMVGFTIFTGMRFPLLGTVMGAVVAFGAKLLYRGTDFTLGVMSAVVAFITITATLFIMFGIIGMALSFISVIIGTAMAFKIASG